jgi:glycosyltransferase involved in cell wall biosynthesis
VSSVGEDIVQPVESNEPETETLTVTSARTEEKVLQISSDRQYARVLFFTKDASVLTEGSQAFTRITDLRHFFAEVHVIVLNYRTAQEVPATLRFFDTVWIYTTQSTVWWKMSMDAYTLAERELTFGGGFRADIVLTEDVYEAGIAGCFIAKKYNRPLQVHIYEDFFDDEVINASGHPVLYAWISRYVIRRAQSVRTKTEPQRTAVIDIHKEISEKTELLPSYYDLSAWRDFVPTFNLHERYPKFKFIIAHISSMHTASHSYEILLGVSPLLRRYPTVGLVVVGNGPLRSQLEKQAIALGLQKQIEFEPMPSEIVSHLKSANVLIHLSEDAGEDEILLTAASVKVPLIANTHSIAGTLFQDKKSARLCEPSDSACVTDSVNMLLNDNHIRTEFALKAQDIVFERIEQDYNGYLESYAASIERTLA